MNMENADNDRHCFTHYEYTIVQVGAPRGRGSPSYRVVRRGLRFNDAIERIRKDKATTHRRTELCRYYHTPGLRCNKTLTCNYAHGIKQLRPIVVPIDWKTAPCPYYKPPCVQINGDNNQCNRGSRCGLAHAISADAMVERAFSLQEILMVFDHLYEKPLTVPLSWKSRPGSTTMRQWAQPKPPAWEPPSREPPSREPPSREPPLQELPSVPVAPTPATPPSIGMWLATPDALSAPATDIDSAFSRLSVFEYIFNESIH